MTGIYLVALVFSECFDVVPALDSREPVSRIIIGDFDTALGKRFRVDPLYVALFPQFREIVLQRPVAKVGTLIGEISVESEPRECQTTVYQEGENSLFALLLSHITTVASVPNRFTGIIIVLIYWQSFVVLTHNFPIQGKLFVSTVQQSQYAEPTRGLVTRRWVQPRKPRRTPLWVQRVRVGIRETGTNAMTANDSRGQETPDRPTNRNAGRSEEILTDGGEAAEGSLYREVNPYTGSNSWLIRQIAVDIGLVTYWNGVCPDALSNSQRRYGIGHVVGEGPQSSSRFGKSDLVAIAAHLKRQPRREFYDCTAVELREMIAETVGRDYDSDRSTTTFLKDELGAVLMECARIDFRQDGDPA